MEKKNLPVGKEGRPDPAQIAKWKKEFGDIYHVRIDNDDMEAYLRQPTLNEIEFGIIAKNKKGASPLDFNRTVLKYVTLYMDPGFMGADARALELLSKMDDIMPNATATVEKL